MEYIYTPEAHIPPTPDPYETLITEYNHKYIFMVQRDIKIIALLFASFFVLRISKLIAALAMLRTNDECLTRKISFVLSYLKCLFLANNIYDGGFMNL